MSKVNCMHCKASILTDKTVEILDAICLSVTTKIELRIPIPFLFSKHSSTFVCIAKLSCY